MLIREVSLAGQTALITGAAGGLGRVICSALAELGADIILSDLSQESCESSLKDLRLKYNVEAESIPCDLEHASQREELLALAANRKNISILVNNAAFVGTSNLSGWTEQFELQSLETWGRAMEVNLTSAFHLSQGFGRLLKQDSKGVILNVASIYGEYGPDWSLYQDTKMANPAAYAASKGGLIQLTRWLSTTLAPRVRVNAISPGGVYNGQDKLFVDRYTTRTPLGRMANYEDFAGSVAFLCSDLSSYVTGQVLRVDGGWGVW